MNTTSQAGHADPSRPGVRERQASPYRTWRIVALSLTLVALAATALFLVLFLPIFTIASASVLILAFAALLLMHRMEHRGAPRTWPGSEQRTTTTRPQDTTPAVDAVEPSAPAPVQKAGLRTAVIVVVSILVLAVLLAAVIALFVSPDSFNWRAIGIGAVVVFAFMLLIGAPAWLAAVEEEMVEEEEEISGESRAIH